MAELSQSVKEMYGVAREASDRTGEVLVFGRVFVESIEANLMFTTEVSIQ